MGVERSRVRALAVVLAAAVLLGIAVVAASAAAGDDGRQLGDPSAKTTFGVPPSLVPQFRREMDRAERREEERARPEARAERRRSRSAFKGVDRAGAIALAKDQFPQVFGQPLWTGPRLAEGERIDRYVSDSAYVVDRPGHASDLLTASSAPVRAEDEDGHK